MLYLATATHIVKWVIISYISWYLHIHCRKWYAHTAQQSQTRVSAYI